MGNPLAFPGAVPSVIRGSIAFDTTGGKKYLGTIPAGSMVVGSPTNVKTAFNAGTTNVLTIGSEADNDLIATSTTLAGGTAGSKNGALYVILAEDTDIYLYYSQTGTAATTGEAEACVLFYPYES